MTITGTVKRFSMGTGTWGIAADDGTTYELQDAPPELLQAELKVKVEGRLREDVMTLAAIGPVLEVDSFETI